jgi:hypothetical protein
MEESGPNAMSKSKAVVCLAVFFTGCSALDQGGGGAGPYIYATVFTLAGGGESPYFGSANVFVCADSGCSAPIPTATVTVNGVALTYDAAAIGYYDTGNLIVAEGAVVTLNVTLEPTSYSASGTQLTTPPTVTAPTPGVTWTGADDNTISWTGGAPTAAADYYVQMYDSNYNQVFPIPPATQSGEVPITATSVTVPAGTLPTGTLSLMVGIISQGAIFQDFGGIPIPNAATGSGLWFGLLAPIVPVTVQ